MQARDLISIINAASAKHKIAREVLLGPSRTRLVMACRREIYTHLRGLGWSYPRIGEAFNRDHSSIIVALNGKPGRRRKAKPLPMPIASGPIKQAAIDAWWKARGF